MDHQHGDGDGVWRIASANLHYGGVTARGGTQDLDATLEVVARWEPHVLLLQEVTANTAEAMTLAPRVPDTWAAQEKLAAGRAAEADTATIAHLTRIADELGMRVASLGPPRTELFRRMHNAVLVSPGIDVVRAGPPVPVPGSSNPAWAEAVLRVPGAEHELAVYSVHLPPRSGTLQRIQAEWLASHVAQEGRHAILGGDWNSIPRTEHPSEADLRLLNPHLRASRTARDADALSPDWAVDDMLRAISTEDAAACLASEQREPRELTATGPSGLRVDRFYVTGELARAAAVRGYRQTSEGGSDHDVIMISLDLQALNMATPAGYRP